MRGFKIILSLVSLFICLFFARRYYLRQAVQLFYLSFNQQTIHLFEVTVRSLIPPPLDKQVWAVPKAGQELSVVIVEPRAHPNLPGVLYNMAHVYGGENVPMYIFHGSTNKQFVQEIIKTWKNVVLIYLNVVGLKYPGKFLHSYFTIRRIQQISPFYRLLQSPLANLYSSFKQTH